MWGVCPEVLSLNPENCWFAQKDTQKFCLHKNLKLEREVAGYKSRLDELRKAKNSVIIKKTTEYINTGPVV